MGEPWRGAPLAASICAASELAFPEAVALIRQGGRAAHVEKLHAGMHGWLRFVLADDVTEPCCSSVGGLLTSVVRGESGAGIQPTRYTLPLYRTFQQVMCCARISALGAPRGYRRLPVPPSNPPPPCYVHPDAVEYTGQGVVRTRRPA